MAADIARIAALPKERYAIQLMTADERNHLAIESYLRTLGNELNADLILLLPTSNVSEPRVMVLYGNFDGTADAGPALTRLPARLSKFRPYIRPFGAIRNELRSRTP